MSLESSLISVVFGIFMLQIPEGVEIVEVVVVVEVVVEAEVMHEFGDLWYDSALLLA